MGRTFFWVHGYTDFERIQWQGSHWARRSWPGLSVDSVMILRRVVMSNLDIIHGPLRKDDKLSVTRTSHSDFLVTPQSLPVMPFRRLHWTQCRHYRRRYPLCFETIFRKIWNMASFVIFRLLGDFRVNLISKSLLKRMCLWDRTEVFKHRGFLKP